MSLYDAKESNESGDVADIQWYVESLSKSIVTLEEDLSIALTIAKKEKEVPLDEIRKWRSEQKEHINEFKLIIRNLQKQSDTINEQSTLRRRALEDEERQREMQWIDQRH